MATLLASGTFGFADGSTGHVCNLGSAPAVGEFDVLCVNSDTVVSTPSGFTSAEAAVANQGAYIFTRKAVGGEAATVTVTTTGNFNAQVSWSRWTRTGAVDTSTNTQVNSTLGSSTPAHSTGTMAEAKELVVAFAALHSTGTANQSAPSWSTGFTHLTTSKQASGGQGVAGLVGYKLSAGTTAEAPSVSWTGDQANDRYMLTVSITNAAITVLGAAVTSLGPLTATGAGLRTVVGAAATNLGALTATAAGTRTVYGAAAADLGALTATARGVVIGLGIRTGSWYSLLDIYREAADDRAAERARPPIACPNDGEPLQQGLAGSLFCPFDGFQWPRDRQYL